MHTLAERICIHRKHCFNNIIYLRVIIVIYLHISCCFWCAPDMTDNFVFVSFSFRLKHLLTLQKDLLKFQQTSMIQHIAFSNMWVRVCVCVCVLISIFPQMEQVCLLHLDEGKPKQWPTSLKRSIVTRYINSQKDLKDLLESKRGWWASIKGFFQWLYGLLDILFSDEWYYPCV